MQTAILILMVKTAQDKMSSQSHTTPRRIVLTGFMGSGKSTVGPLLADHLGWEFVDVDQVIEADAGTTIVDIFSRYGEKAFRDREHAAIARLTSGENLVMALGGGAIERADTRKLLLETPETFLVHLEVELKTTLVRCGGTESTRPVLADHANLGARYERRLPLYRMAHFTVRTDDLTPKLVAQYILEAAGLWE